MLSQVNANKYFQKEIENTFKMRQNLKNQNSNFGIKTSIKLTFE